MQYRLSIFVLWFALFQSSLTASATPSPGADQLPEPYGQGSYISGKFGKIYYEEEGSGTPIIMINGGPGASRTVFWGAFNY